jgi:hypothetical protein
MCPSHRPTSMEPRRQIKKISSSTGEDRKNKTFIRDKNKDQPVVIIGKTRNLRNSTVKLKTLLLYV